MSEPTGGTGRGMKLHTKIMIGLVVGAVLGITANALLGTDSPTVAGINRYVAGPVGQIFLRLLFMIVVPLVFASISLGVASLGDLRRVGRIGGKTLQRGCAIGIGLDLIALGFQEHTQRRNDVAVVVNECDCGHVVSSPPRVSAQTWSRLGNCWWRFRHSVQGFAS